MQLSPIVETAVEESDVPNFPKDSQTATYKAEIHALNTELANMAERSELQVHSRPRCAA